MPFPEVLDRACDVLPPHAHGQEAEEPPFAEAAFSIRPGGGGKVDDSFAGGPAAAAEIDVFEEQEETRIKSSQLLAEVAAHHKASADDPVRLARLVRIAIPLQVASHPFGEEAAQRGALDDDVHGSWKGSVGIPHRAIGVEELRSENADGWVVQHVARHLFHRVGRKDFRRVIEQEQIAACVLEAEIVSAAEAHVLRGFENAHGGEILEASAQDPDRIVLRVIVHDEDFHLIRDRLTEQGLHTVHRLLGGSVVEDDGGDERRFHGVALL